MPRNDGLSDIGSLQQLGYTDSVDATSDRPQGVVVHRADAVAPGLTMMTVHRGGRAFLLDETGKLVHEWVLPTKVWGHAQLLKDGSILVAAIDEDTPTLLYLSWDSKVLFRVGDIEFHHDADQREDGRLTALIFSWNSLPEFTQGDDEVEVRDDSLVVLDEKGTVLEVHSMLQMLSSDPDVFTFKEVEIRPGDGKKRKDQLDLLHANSIYWMREHDAKKHPLFAVGNVLVSMRHQDAMAIVRPETGQVLWSWGQGELSGPHDATVLANGNLMIFDNGLAHRRSRVVEVDPDTKEIVWEWQAPNPQDIFTIARGSSQRLNNGNTLLLNSDSGHALEVTTEGEVVWEYFHPVEDGRVASLVRAQRYPRSAFPQLEEGP